MVAFTASSVGEPQLKPLDSRMSACHFTTDNRMSFEKQFVACYWALGEMDHLTVRCQMTLRPELLITV